MQILYGINLDLTENSVGVVSKDTLHNDKETGNGLKKRKTATKVGNTLNMTIYLLYIVIYQVFD